MGNQMSDMNPDPDDPNTPDMHEAALAMVVERVESGGVATMVNLARAGAVTMMMVTNANGEQFTTVMEPMWVWQLSRVVNEVVDAIRQRLGHTVCWDCGGTKKSSPFSDGWPDLSDEEQMMRLVHLPMIMTHIGCGEDS